MQQNRIIYSLNVGDIQTVAGAELGRKLTAKELAFVENRLGDYLNWYDAILYALNEMAARPANTDP